MMRIVVLGQSGAFGSAWCRYAASRLAGRLDLPCIIASEATPDLTRDTGWVVTATVGAVPDAILRAADTTVWLHYSPLAVMRAWLCGMRAQFGGSAREGQTARLADVRDSVLHMAWTPHLHRLLRHPALRHLQIFHLRDPDETDFWLRAQEHRLRQHRLPAAQPA
jgi:hypothetical protein